MLQSSDSAVQAPFAGSLRVPLSPSRCSSRLGRSTSEQSAAAWSHAGVQNQLSCSTDWAVLCCGPSKEPRSAQKAPPKTPHPAQ